MLCWTAAAPPRNASPAEASVARVLKAEVALKIGMAAGKIVRFEEFHDAERVRAFFQLLAQAKSQLSPPED